MDINMFEPATILVIVGGFIGLLLIFGSPFKPIKLIGTGLVKIILGALGLFIINSIGTILGFHIPINLMTASVSGFLGLPGMIALVVIDQVIL